MAAERREGDAAPGFELGRFREELRVLHRRIEADGVFVAHSTRFLIEARRTA